MTISFGFQVRTDVRFGAGMRLELPAILREGGWSRVGFVIDHNLRSEAIVEDLVALASTSLTESVVRNCDVSEPTYDSLEEARPEFEDRELQAIVGIGGGSALDMAKAMAVLVRNRGPAIQYRGFDRMTKPVLPIVALPTTAGTGSEITPNASFVDTQEQRKMGINGEAVRPAIALLDPELTLSCPERATVSAGVDSLVHATEAYVARKSNVLARLLAREGFGHVFGALPRVVEAPRDVELRSQVMYGAFLAGLALMHSGTGPAAALSYPLGVHHRVPHGLGGAVFLPHVARLNVARGVYEYADLYLTMEGAEAGLDRRQQAERFVERVISTWHRLHVPTTLGNLEIGPGELDRIVRDTLALEAALVQNPVPFGERELRSTLAQLGAGVP